MKKRKEKREVLTRGNTGIIYIIGRTIIDYRYAYDII